MKLGRPKTEKYHNYEDGDCGHPISNYFKKKFWKRNDRKKFIKNLFKNIKDE
jgi:hypothetical protein